MAEPDKKPEHADIPERPEEAVERVPVPGEYMVGWPGSVYLLFAETRNTWERFWIEWADEYTRWLDYCIKKRKTEEEAQAKQAG